MLLTKEQLSEQMRKHAEKKNGLHDLIFLFSCFWLGIECRNHKHSHYQNLPILSSFSREACFGRIKYLPLLALSYSGIPAKELCYLCLWQITSKFIYARRGMRLRCQNDLFVPMIAPNT